MTKPKDANEAKLAGAKPKTVKFKPEASAEKAPAPAAPAVLTDDKWKWLGDRPGWLGRKPPPREYLLTAKVTSQQHMEGGVLGAAEVGVIAGAGAAGKTRAAVQLAVAVATGTDWLGTFKVERPGRVLLALAEEAEEDVRRLLYFAARRLGEDTKHAAALGRNIMPLGLKGDQVTLATYNDWDASMEDTTFGSELKARLSDGEPWSLVIIDPAVSFAPVEAEKDNAAAQRWINLLARIATDTIGRPAVLQIHHTNKASRRQLEDFTSMDTRGVSALTDGPRWAAGLFPATKQVKVGKGKPKVVPVLDRVCFRVTKVNHGIYPDTIYLRRGDAGCLEAMTSTEVLKEQLGDFAEEPEDDDKKPAKDDPGRASRTAKLTGGPVPAALLKKGAA